MEIRQLSHQDSIPMDLLLLADPSEEMIQKYITRGETYIAEHGGIVVGVYVFVSLGEGTVEIMNIAVREEFQGKGLGKQLILDAMNRIKQAGYKRIEIGTGNSSIGQLALYQKCGFRISGIKRDFFLRNYPELIMENGIQCVDMIRLSVDL
ncbi:GNAT family N-acetyltransferase [Robertmurraya yapensis]|uniref:GNAT family N-acetyltransferase n=1 Tax=Bacillus yapensis TaxID=2492960 RepID=A0A3S0KW42_9BACI|nr:GNAT family N-acetyltransferase [Bacillus yapensis]RTR35708.1 GNAT family N-acetyltransferase [Bacillus yapensis]TKS98510.1 GNAT family N-acetyltransferase [Bacillus yapensis]